LGADARLDLFRDRRTLLAHLRVRVPANLCTHPVATVPALEKERLDFIDGLAQHTIVLLAADRPLHLVGRVGAGSESATEEARRAAQESARHADLVRLERAHEPAAAPLAHELELEPHVGRQIFVIPREFDGGCRSALRAEVGWRH